MTHGTCAQEVHVSEKFRNLIEAFDSALLYFSSPHPTNASAAQPRRTSDQNTVALLRNTPAVDGVNP